LIEIPGLTYDAGQGALCVLCHSGDADIFDGTFIRPFVPGNEAQRGRGHAQTEDSYVVDPDNAPHASQALLLTGRGGRFLDITNAGSARYRAYPHMWVEDTCAGCHFDAGEVGSTTGNHTFRLAPEGKRIQVDAATRCWADFDVDHIETSTKTRSCEACHGVVESLSIKARGDFDGDGRVTGLVVEVEGLMTLLRAEIERHLRASEIAGADGTLGVTFTIAGEKTVVADRDCVPIETDDGGHVRFRGLDPLLGKATHNYLLVARDGSAGIHNPRYVVRLLQDSIAGLEKARGAEIVHRWRR